MHKTSGTSTLGVKEVSATTITTFTIFSRLHGVCVRILELIATEPGTEKCRRQPEEWSGSIGGSCMVLPRKLQKANEAVRIRLRVLGDCDSDPSDGLLGEEGFFLREQKREQDREVTMRLERNVILVGIDEDVHDKQYPLTMVRALANRIVGQIIHERIYRILLSDARSPSRHLHPPPKVTGVTVTHQKGPQVYRRPVGFTELTMAHRAAMSRGTGNRHVLRPPIKGNSLIRLPRVF